MHLVSDIPIDESLRLLVLQKNMQENSVTTNHQPPAKIAHHPEHVIFSQKNGWEHLLDMQEIIQHPTSQEKEDGSKQQTRNAT